MWEVCSEALRTRPHRTTRACLPEAYSQQWKSRYRRLVHRCYLRGLLKVCLCWHKEWGLLTSLIIIVIINQIFSTCMVTSKWEPEVHIVSDLENMQFCRLDLWPCTKTKPEAWLLETWFDIAMVNKLVSLAYLLWAPRSFQRYIALDAYIFVLKAKEKLWVLRCFFNKGSEYELQRQFGCRFQSSGQRREWCTVFMTLSYIWKIFMLGLVLLGSEC